MNNLIYLLLGFYILLFAYLAWRHFYTALILLFAFLPTYLIRFQIGRVPTTLLEIMVIIIISVWVIKILKIRFSIFKKLFYRQVSLFIAILLFLTGATISIFTSINIRAALGEWKAFYVEPVLIFLVLITTFQKSRNSEQQTENNLTLKSSNNKILANSPTAQNITNYILFALIISGLATSLLAIYQHFTGWMVPPSFWANQATYRVTAWYGFPNGVGLFLAPLVPLTLYLITYNWKKIKQLKIRYDESRNSENKKPLFIIYYSLLIFSLLFIPSALLAIYYAQSTGALIGIAAGISALLLMRRKTRWPIIALGVAAIIGLVLMPSNNPIKQELLMQDYSGQLRLNMWAETTAFLTQQPVVGAGLASYSQLIAPYRIDKTIEIFHHPHNIFLTMWVNVGLVGLIGFGWIIVWFYRAAFAASRSPYLITRNKNFIPFLIAIITTIMTTGLVDSPYIKNDLAILFWLWPALLITTTANENA